MKYFTKYSLILSVYGAVIKHAGICGLGLDDSLSIPPHIRYRVHDPKTKKVHHVRVAFQVCVKPGSYKVGPQTIGANEPIDPQISNSEIVTNRL